MAAVPPVNLDALIESINEQNSALVNDLYDAVNEDIERVRKIFQEHILVKGEFKKPANLEDGPLLRRIEILQKNL